MTNLLPVLLVSRCPHCGVDHPNLSSFHGTETNDYKNSNRRLWAFYICARCGGVVIASALEPQGEIVEMYPPAVVVSDEIPSTAREYLEQALHSLHVPAGAVMLAASAVDAMLKAKGLSEGSLYSRIKTAAEQHLITPDMAEWAHDVRLEANSQRHADGDALPNDADARRSVAFAQALADFMFVFPARVQRARGSTK